MWFWGDGGTLVDGLHGVGGGRELAVRLCGKAGPWQVLVDRAASDLADGVLVISEHPPVELKGNAHPVPTYLVEFQT